ncbi:MAG: hypothetical protein LUH07_11205 [Lachnospiraceae bacterium]|nr:hypothetical protein [Lachnospiraceae bacterium]
MADTQFEVAKAEAWKREVEAEFDEVKTLLDRVSEECQQKPYEDDTLLNALHNTGEKLEETWNELGNQFQKVTDALGEITEQWKKVIAEGIETISEYASKISIS